MNNLPPAFIRSLQHLKGFDEEAFRAVHQSGDQVTSIRRNPQKIGNRQPPTGNFEFERVGWCEYGCYISQRPSFTADPLFHAGAYYVQEASSMFLEQALKQTVDLSQPLKILDLCAAPGGKSTLIQSIISTKSLLVSNEVIKTRVNVLSENMTKWGASNVIVTNNDPLDFQRLENYFDLVVVDAPCSGSGLFRKDPAAIAAWSENNVMMCNRRQQRILADVLPSLKEGGILIYATCSYSSPEDEEIADWLVHQFKIQSLKLLIDDDWGIVETLSGNEKAFGYRFYPDKVRGEGFFIAVFRKPGAGKPELGVGSGEYEVFSGEQGVKKSKNRSAILSAAELDIIKPFVNNADDYFFIRQEEEIIALPGHLQKELPVIKSALYIKKAGVKIGTVIRNELIPDHQLALSTIINLSVKRIEVDKETALCYLRREEIKLETTITGWTLISYQDLPLGWIKILPNRINNYYPKEWRILNK